MQREYTVEADHLAVGLTRSPMFMGVNTRLFFANVVLGTLICIDAHTFLGVPLFLVLHLVMVKFSLKEPNFFTIWVKALVKTPTTMNYRFWGRTNSYGPW